jgi:NAD-reducing hydrogenase large subunit
VGRQILIDPVTRIEGHAKITIQLDDHGTVNDARFHVTQYRGFEKFAEARPFHEMPSLTARICGICPVSHLMASAKTCNDLMAVRIPPTAVNLRRLMNLGQYVQSHALSFFHLSSPDLLLGMDADPTQRNVLGVLQSNPSIARDGIRLRQFGQQIIEILGGKRIHPAWVVAGGVNEPLSQENRDHILSQVPEMLDIVDRALTLFKDVMDKHQPEIQSFANFPTLFLGLVNDNGEPDFYDGKLRITDSEGRLVVDKVDPKNYHDYIAEAVEPWTYLKFPYYREMGYPQGIYRVGPLARMNIADRCGTPRADQEWAEFSGLHRGAVLSSFYYHYARLIEILYSIELIEHILHDPDILSTHVRSYAGPNNQEGIGVSEAPRGILIHHYKINEEGLIQWANLIIATGHNNLAMNRGVLQVAKHFVKGQTLSEGMLNRVEAVIRAFDPCLSCSTHAIGQMPLNIELMTPDGEVVDRLRRDGDGNAHTTCSLG